MWAVNKTTFLRADDDVFFSAASSFGSHTGRKDRKWHGTVRLYNIDKSQ